jgi:hypothetical protein
VTYARVSHSEARYELLWDEFLHSNRNFYLVSLKPQSLRKRKSKSLQLRPQFNLEEGKISQIEGGICSFTKLSSDDSERVACIRLLPPSEFSNQLFREMTS